MRRASFVLGVILVAACAGCGDGAAVTPDAPVDTPPPDEIVFPGCTEFQSASPVMVPVRVIGQLGNADVQSPATCDDVEAPFGIESNGPDRVIPLDGLVPGATYVVRLSSSADLAFYVATGCETPTGPSAAQCLLFADAQRNARELGRFVANAPTAYVVVDYWESQAPASTDFTLEVYEEACTSGAQCGATPSSPACFEGQCVQCVTSFECGSASSPVCGTNQVCTNGADTCTSDDVTEPGDDGPSGATPIVLDGTGHSSIAAKICSVPRTEYDYFSFEVTTLGETWTFSLAWTGQRDLDLGVYDPSGTQLGLSFWEQPETIRLSYLAPGTYYVRVRDFSSAGQAAPVNYTLATQRTLGAGCTAASQCAAEYRNQIYRGNCSAGSCVSIEAPGNVTEGGACDSASDCGANLSCPSFFFVSDADTRETCTRSCANDGDCSPLGTDHVCTTYLTQNFCVQKCTENDHCPTSIQSDPASGPWARLRCDMPTGRCVP